jgi:hypothetical protein
MCFILWILKLRLYSFRTFLYLTILYLYDTLISNSYFTITEDYPMTNLDQSDDDLKDFEAEQLVKQTNNPDDLVHLVVEDEHHWLARQGAAEKLIKMWEESRQGGITLDHLTYVGDHADEPHKSKANQIIRDNI